MIMCLWKVWNTEDTAKKVSKWCAWIAVVIAFVSGISGIFRLVEPLANVFTIIAIILAFFSGICGFLSRLLDHRTRVLGERAKKLPPELDVSIKTSEESGELLVIIEPKNKVPFEYQWLIVTKDNIVVSGLPLEWGKLYPNNYKGKFIFEPAKFNKDRVAEGYIELRFKYRSPYAAEFADPNLVGLVTRRYQLTPDKKFCIPIDGAA
jgi:hypothetical protein